MKENILDKIEFAYDKEATGKGVKQLYHKKLKTIISIREKYTGLKPDSFEQKKPTIAELEKILDGPSKSVTLNPDGSITTKPKSPLIELLPSIIEKSRENYITEALRILSIKVDEIINYINKEEK